MDISSSNYFSVSASTNKGMSGMISGMDTESMVKQMLSGTQSKIDKQQGLKTQSEWKQDIYRELITSINDFQNKYFDTTFDSTLSTNFAKSAFFNTMVSSLTSGSGVRILSTGSDATVGDLDVTVKQLASNASLLSSKKMSDGRRIEGAAVRTDILTSNFQKKLSFEVDGTDIQVNLNNATTEDGVVDAINDALSNANCTTVSAKLFDGRLRLVTTGKDVKITNMKANSYGSSMTGASSISSSVVKGEDGVERNILQFGTMHPTAGPTLTVTLDGIQKQISLNNVADSTGNITTDSISKQLSAEMSKAFGSYVSVNYTEANGKGTFSLGTSFYKKSSNGALVDANNQEIQLNGKSAYDYKDGVFFDEDGKKIDSATPSNPTDITAAEQKLVNESGHQLTVTGIDAKKLGITAGSSTTIGSITKLSELGLSGDRFKFKVNDVEFTFSGNDSIGTMMNTINNSSAGVRMTYSALSDNFSLESTSTGSKYNIELEQIQGNLLSGLFNDANIAINSGGSVASKTLTTESILSQNDPAIDYSNIEVKSGASFTINVNGSNKIITLPTNEKGSAITYKGSQIFDEINKQLKEAFYQKDADGNILDAQGRATSEDGYVINADGTYILDSDGEKIKAEKTAAITLNNDGSLKIDQGPSTTEDLIVKFNATKVDLDNGEAVAEAKKTDLALLFGLNREASNNIATANTKISELVQFKNKTIPGITGDPKLGDLGNGVTVDVGDVNNPANKASITFADGRMVMTGTTDITISGSVFEGVFGKDIKLGDGKVTKGITKGTDAVVTIDGVDTTRSSNTFTANGITMEVTKVDTAANTISVKQDTDTIVKGFQSFIEDYNNMIEKLTKYVDADRTYRKYDPLTSEQKKEMSEKEIELWEEKAKEGLLHRDSDIDTFLSQLRLAMYTKPEGGKLALYDIGIETGDYKDQGKLSMDESKLRNALSTDPQSVATLFTASGGISAQVMKAIKATANISSASPGSLVQMAGVKGRASESNNTLSINIKSISDKIKDLQKKYEQERQRYWNQFNSMEKTLANFNSQSSYFSQQFGG